MSNKVTFRIPVVVEGGETYQDAAPFKEIVITVEAQRQEDAANMLCKVLSRVLQHDSWSQIGVNIR